MWFSDCMLWDMGLACFLELNLHSSGRAVDDYGKSYLC
jgi:hypothetical protein